MGNQHGKHGKYGSHIDWDNAEKPWPPGKPYLISDNLDHPPDVIVIRWDPSQQDGGAPILGYLVEHRRTGSPHWLRATPHLVQDTELVLTGLEPGWRYQFRVSAENDIGRSDPGELSEPLTVTLQRSAASAPHFNRELQDTIALENDKVEFVVNVLGTPTPKISWYKDGFEIFSSRRTKIVNENEQSMLIIHQAALEDEGEIKCTATNRAGHVVTKAYLKLEAPPRVRLPRQYEDGLLFEIGEVIRLKVSVTGRPMPYVAWYHNGEEIVTEGRVEVSTTDRNSMLRVTDACRDDRGDYQIKVYNKIGEDVASCLVTVTDRPLSPGKAQVVMTLGRSVTLAWAAPDDDGGCKIGNYIVEYFRIGWNMWLKAATCRQLTTVLGNLIEGSEYKFRVKAENPYGVSDPSEESEVVFIPDLKRGLLVAPPKIEQDPSDPWVEEMKKRQLEEDKNEQEVKRRKGLEERAERLLGNMDRSPLLTVSQPNKRPSPALSDVDMSKSDVENDVENVPPAVPRRRGKKTSDLMEEILIKDKTVDKLETQVDGSEVIPNKQVDQWRLAPREDDSVMHGSSELMLVLLPHGQTSKSTELTPQQRSQIESSLLNGDGVAPPMSLSAPELGTAELLEIPPMRDAVSSTELLHERALARFYQEAAEEESMMNVKRRYSQDRKSLERRSSIKEHVLERRHSTKEGEVLELQVTHLLEERASEPRSIKIEVTDERDKTEKKSVLAAQIKEDIAFKNQMRSEEQREKRAGKHETMIHKKEERLNSVEREQLEFAMVRDKLRIKNEENLKPRTLPPRPPTLQQQSTMSSQMSSYEGDDTRMLDEELDHKIGEEEDEEEEGYLEDEEELEEDEDLEQEADEHLNDAKYRPKSLLPPPVPQHAPTSPIKKPSPPALKRPAPYAEEETYHPRSMIPTRSFIKELEINLPTTVEIADEPEVEQSNKQDESVKEEDKVEEQVSKIPVPKKPKKRSQIMKKIEKLSLKKEKKPSAVAALIVDSAAPVTSVVLPKPILKKKLVTKKKDREDETPEKSLKTLKPNTVESKKTDGEESSQKKKKQVRIAEPGAKSDQDTAIDPNLSPTSARRARRMQEKQLSLEEDEQANKVLIYHYSDIVREYGGPKKTIPKMYLNYEELKAHANPEDEEVELPEPEPESESVVEEVEEAATEAEETATVELNEYDEQGSVLDIPEGIEPFAKEPEPIAMEPELETIPEEEKEPTPARSGSQSPTSSTASGGGGGGATFGFMVDYATDLALFVVACWLYFFKNEKYAIPVLCLMVYRQINETVARKYKNIKEAITNKIPQRFRKTSVEETNDNQDDN